MGGGHCSARPIAARVWINLFTLVAVLGCSEEHTPTKTPPVLTLENASYPFASPTWSADGSRLYFNHVPLKQIYKTRLNTFEFEFYDSLEGFYVLDLSSDAMRRIVPRGLGNPELSPNGSALFYDREGQIWRMPAQGDSFDLDSEVQVTSSPSGAFAASVSYSNTRLLYYVGGAGLGSGIYITSVDGGAARHVGGLGWHDPDWQPSDRAFAFTSYGNVVTGVAVVDTFGAGARELRNEGVYPKWAPDGSKIAFVGVGQTLWIMNPDGTDATQITTEKVASSLSWSPDSRRIAYIRAEEETSWTYGTLWTIEPSTGERRQITKNTRP